jgi:biotin carboxylase
MVTKEQPEQRVATHREPAAPNSFSNMTSQNGRRIILLTTPASYRGNSFLTAATSLGLDVIHGVDMPTSLAEHWHMTLGLDFTNPFHAAEELAAFVATNPVDAIIAIDDSATLLAAAASAAVGLPHNDPASAFAARDKYVMRARLREAGVRVPDFERHVLTQDPKAIASDLTFPVVVKPLQLSGSRGVIRADSPDEFVVAFERTRQLLVGDGHPAEETSILVEQYLPGEEVALEGLLTREQLQVLALFDKPDPLVGPFFEETIYVTPSRHSKSVQHAIAKTTAAAAAALGLREGPVHAELRINDEGIWPIELAGRSIGGLCSTILEFGSGVSLEEIILRHAVGMEIPSTQRTGKAAGVMMIPIPRGGVLRSVEGQEEACAVPGITGVEITAKLNYPIVPLPEGASYLGFIFARGETPGEVEQALRDAHERLAIKIDPLIPIRTSV